MINRTSDRPVTSDIADVMRYAALNNERFLFEGGFNPAGKNFRIFSSRPIRHRWSATNSYALAKYLIR